MDKYDTLISLLICVLKRGDVFAGIGLMRDWLAQVRPGEPDTLLERCPVAFKSRVASLMRDVMTDFPQTVMGVPTLLYLAGPDGSEVQLPCPTKESEHPCKDLTFLGWAPSFMAVPLEQPYSPQKTPSFVRANKCYAFVALFKVQPEVAEAEEIVIPDSWWVAQLCALGNFRVSARLQLPYPDSFEAARVMGSAATDEEYPEHCNFLAPPQWHVAWELGRLFGETNRRLNTDF